MAKTGLIIVIVVIIFIVIAGIFYLRNGETEKDTDNGGLTTLTGETKQFNIIAKNWEFDPETIEVNKGDIVKINIKSIDVTHGISLPEFGVNERLEPNEEVNIEFIVDKTGEFRFSCNVFCGSGHGGMRGTLRVN